jgi:hypothetical protein
MLDSVCPPQLSHLLGEINARLDNPEQGASARLKLVLPTSFNMLLLTLKSFTEIS